MFVIDRRFDDPERPTTPFGLIAHPKTGSQSIRQALRGQLKARSPGGHHGIDEDEIARIIGEGGCVSTVIRNPYDLFVSWWTHEQSMANSYESFIQWTKRVMVSGNGWIEKGLFYGSDHCNHIIRFEHDMEYQLNNALEACGLPSVKLDHIGKGDRTHYRDYYDIDTAIAVDRYCRNEILEWGYEF